MASTTDLTKAENNSSEQLKKPIDVGVIGVGSMGHHHARVYNQLSDATLVGVSDVDAERAGEVANEFDTEVLSRQELLTQVDAVSIAVPTQFHREVAMDCIEHGVDILIEKPLAGSAEEATDIVEAAESAGLTVQVGHIERFNPAVVALQDIIADIDIISVDAERLGPPLDREIEDSVVKDLMIHDIDILHWLIDLSASSISVFDSNEAHTTANFQFEDGTIASLTASRVTQRKVRKLTITAHSCRIEVDYIDRTVEIYRHSLPEYIEKDGDMRYRHESIVERPMVGNEEPLKNELSSFLDSLQSGEAPRVSGRDGLQVVEYVDKIEDLATSEND